MNWKICNFRKEIELRIMILTVEANTKSLKQVVEIYREAFPNTTRSLLGQKACMNYFERVLWHPSYRLIIAKDEEEIVGFIVFRINSSNKINRAWILIDWVSVMKFIFTKPIYLIKRLRQRANAYVKTKREYITKENKEDSQFLGKRACIDEIAVKKSDRGRGVGRALIQHCIKIAKNKKLDYIKLTVMASNFSTIKFYETLNFRKRQYDKATNSYIFIFPIREWKENQYF